jgi:hypothetical protein
VIVRRYVHLYLLVDTPEELGLRINKLIS